VKVQVHGFEPHRPRSDVALRDGDEWVASRRGPSLKKIFLTIYFEFFSAATFFVFNRLAGTSPSSPAPGNGD
jgi:hypothetical protein